MRSRVLAAACVVLSFVPAAAAVAEKAAEKKPLTIEVICDEDLTPPAPQELRWTPGGRLAYFLEIAGEDGEEDAGRDLWVVDPATGQRRILVTADELRRLAPSPSQAGVDERERTRRTRFEVSAYHFSPAGDKILFASAGRLWLYDLESRQAELRAPERHGVGDPKFSPDGAWISFVADHDLWLVPAAGGEEKRLTTGGHELLLHGDVDWVYAEEFRVRTGYHWSPDSRHVAFLEMDESPVPTYPITDQLDWQATFELQRYPKPGEANPKVRVGIVEVATGRTAWLDRWAEYVPRIGWAGAGRLAVELLNRGQDDLELVLAEAATGRSRSLLRERDPHWVNVTDDLTFLADGRFLWTSERSGLRHLYLYGRDGELERELTAGDFEVGEVAGVDEAAGWVYYTANEDNLLGRDLYRVRLDGSGKERVTREKGTHRIDMSPQANAFADDFSSLDLAEVGRHAIVDLASGRATEIHRDPDLAEYDLVPPRLVELAAPDGALVRMLLLVPRQIADGARLPVVVYVYGMAGFPTIRDAWSPSRRNLFHQLLVQHGYVVAHVDDRSSSLPGHKYAVLADHAVGPVAAADHRLAVEHLRALPYVDGERIAVWGWSGGGFTAAYHMTRSNGLFKVGVAGAPVTDWRLYDSIYTERYMGLPEDDPEAYERTSAVAGAAGLTGRLLLIHGTHDDNVHPQNTLRLAHELIQARKQFDLMLYPNKTHGITGEGPNVHLYTMIFDYLERHLRR